MDKESKTMALVVDLGQGAESKGFDPLPKGTYHVAITDASIEESGPNAKNPGANYIKFEFTVQDGEFENRKLWTNASLLPQALFTLKGIMASTGRDPNASVDIEEYVIECIGDELVLVVNQRPRQKEYADFEGQKENVIKGYKPLSGEGAVPVSGGAEAGKKNSLLP
jgi:hypothetical protein